MPETREGEKKRMIHIRLPADLHRRLRVRAAELDTTIQDWVATLISRVLDRVDSRAR